MNEHHIATSGHLTLVMIFLLFVATIIKGLVLLQCYVTLATIQTDFRIEREAIAVRQRDIMSRLASIEICVDVTQQSAAKAVSQ